MKVVLFCGGFGMRIREYSENIPKPMVPIGYRPVLWHVMKYYAHYGHTEFILCLGHGADVVKDYFLNYSECASNDFVMSQGGKKLDLINTDIQDWRITFADTGTNANIAQRLIAVKKYLGNDQEFIANYSDGLTDLPLPDQLAHFRQMKAVGSFVSVAPRLSYHMVTAGENGVVSGLEEMSRSSLRINGGYMLFTAAIFDFMQPGEELVQEPFQRLIKEQKLVGYRYDGFWASMDTFKDKQVLDEMYAKDRAPWLIWKQSGGHGSDTQKL
ncbi:MAG: glucose-1-phosphate cytidylyltransferase [Nitrospirae bacterium]|nr:glucose-1-phosphate cytidylyltransferase [Nitrospirota bacterium]